jgi:hydroxymethylbilane synthase
MTPAAGQGCLALEARDDDPETAERAAALTDPDAMACLRAERAVVMVLEATCHTPVGAHAVIDGGRLRLTAFAGAPDGSAWVRDQHEGDDPALLGAAVAERMLAAGAAEILP